MPHKTRAELELRTRVILWHQGFTSVLPVIVAWIWFKLA